MSLLLAGIGTAVPRHFVLQDEAAAVNASFATSDPGRARTLKALYRRTGVTKRHSVLLESAEGPSTDRQSFYPPLRGPDDRGPPTELRMQRYEAEAPALTTCAARRALDDASLDAGRVTHLVTVSCTGFFAPGLDAAVIERLGLPKTVERTHVGFMGCHGALNGLRVAASFTGADPTARVLLCSVELCTLHFAYGWHPDQIVPNALFADGAAAVVGVGSDGDGTADIEGRDGSRRWRVLGSGTQLLPDSEDDMTWRIGDHGFRMTLSARVPDLIEANVGAWLTDWLGTHGLRPADVASWAVHPGGPRVLSAFGHAAGLGNGAFGVSREVLAEYGNMSSATVLFILERLRRRGAPLPCVALAFGPGLVIEGALLG